MTMNDRKKITYRQFLRGKKKRLSYLYSFPFNTLICFLEKRNVVVGNDTFSESCCTTVPTQQHGKRQIFPIIPSYLPFEVKIKQLPKGDKTTEDLQ